MDPFVCKFYATRKLKNLELESPFVELGKDIQSLYLAMFQELGIKIITSGNVISIKDKIMNSDNKPKFEHDIGVLLISTYKNLFDYLFGSRNTIEAASHSVELISLGGLPDRSWLIEVKSQSHPYTIRERLGTEDNWESVKAEKGNTLVSAYSGNKFVKYQTLTFNSKFIEVEKI